MIFFFKIKHMVKFSIQVLSKISYLLKSAAARFLINFLLPTLTIMHSKNNNKQ